jgi:3-hydroxybutyryl-CoA dehydrogenase
MTNTKGTVAVIGSGTMGSQIAFVSALANYDVILQDIAEESLQKAEEMLRQRMARNVEKGRVEQAEVDAAFGRLKLTTDLNEVANASVVIEAVVENIDIKRDLFKKLSDIVAPDAILATNSSTIVSSKIADVVTNPERVCNIHFFNPALVMEMVEVVKGPHTSDEVAQKAMEFVRSINKTPALLQKEISGFIANRILGKVFDEAVFLYENGYASHEEIDLICKKALNYPIGPFELMDLVGIDVSYNARLQRYKESGNEADKPAKLLQEKVEKGELGRKTGKGFYTYN